MARPKKDARLEPRDGIWYIVDGDTRISTKTRDEAEAQRALDRHISVTIDRIIEFYVKDGEKRGKKTQHRKYVTRAIVEWWGKKKVADINEANVQAYCDHRRKEGMKDATIRHELQNMIWAVYKAKEEFGLEDPRRIEVPNKSPKKRDYILTRKEIADRLRAARRSPYHRHMCRFILIGLWTGSRKDIVTRFRWSPSPTEPYFDLEAGMCYRAGDQHIEHNKKRGECRIHDALMPHLRRWRRMDRARGIDRVIHYRGVPIRSIDKAWRWLAKECRRKDAPHILKHTIVSWLCTADVPDKEIAAYLATSETTLIRVYEHLRPSYQRRATKVRGK